MSAGVSIFLISVSTWLTPQPQLSVGYLVNYGDQSVVEGMAWWRDYDLAPYYRRCGIAAMSPVHIGRIAWVRVEGGPWNGPCLVLDVVAQHDYARAVYDLGEIAEVPRWLAHRLGFENGLEGQVWFGVCPPPTEDWTIARPYAPRLRWSEPGERRPHFDRYKAQELPGHCPAQNYQ